eukprot:scaffold14604_cov80-Skeletonema_dohrnii-CCMP3373.AAC.2
METFRKFRPQRSEATYKGIGLEHKMWCSTMKRWYCQRSSEHLSLQRMLSRTEALTESSIGRADMASAFYNVCFKTNLSLERLDAAYSKCKHISRVDYHSAERESLAGTETAATMERLPLVLLLGCLHVLVGMTAALSAAVTLSCVSQLQ